MLTQFVIKTIFIVAINMTQGTFWDQKRSWLMMRKFVWFGMILACFVEIDFWDLFGTQILSLNPLVQSENMHNEKYRSFQMFRKVPTNRSFYQLSCLQISCYTLFILRWKNWWPIPPRNMRVFYSYLIITELTKIISFILEVSSQLNWIY